ncbi:hypothetical protein KS4_25720 [Poriferisphaera corsica]|uniref:Uncharacterized protein n=1 Tax=Poriferisphaera corsica TaxID=2528020 RepID=A0A517YWC7_9BACT|nr:hypothetical protein KS4_25720 [Poriferisphaera corsica]
MLGRHVSWKNVGKELISKAGVYAGFLFAGCLVILGAFGAEG